MMDDRVSQSLEFLGPEEKQYLLNEHPKTPVAELFLLLDISAFQVPFCIKPLCYNTKFQITQLP